MFCSQIYFYILHILPTDPSTGAASETQNWKPIGVMFSNGPKARVESALAKPPWPTALVPSEMFFSRQMVIRTQLNSWICHCPNDPMCSSLCCSNGEGNSSTCFWYLHGACNCFCWGWPTSIVEGADGRFISMRESLTF